MRESRGISLDPRLSMIARLVGSCECYADIGCDHGRLGAFLLKSGQCQRALLTDISEPSLQKARDLIALLGLSERVDFCVGDGALALTRLVDAVVIAGMGGSTIARIIREGGAHLKDARLVLQPNVAAPELRGALSACGYAICDERVVQDGRRSYVIIVAHRGVSSYSKKQLTVGPVLLERMPAELVPLARFRLRVAQKALKGASASGDAAQMRPLMDEIGIWEEVLSCLQP